MSIDQNSSEHDLIDLLISHTQSQRRYWIESIPYSKFKEIKRVERLTDHVIYYAGYENKFVVLIPLGTKDKTLEELIEVLSKIYSFPSDTLLDLNDRSQDGKLGPLLDSRHQLIKGFTKNENEYFLVADRCFYHHYTLCDFCSVCGRLRCSPVWCICGHKELSNNWTSGNKKLDEFIRESQQRTETANDSFLEWLPYDWVFRYKFVDHDIFSFPTTNPPLNQSNDQQTTTALFNVYGRFDAEVSSLDISDNTPDSFYETVS
jgi:hypothetical protein